MRNYEIFVDSIANLTDEMISTYGIHVVPYIITVNGKDIYAYEEGKDYNELAAKFYADMEAGATPRSSLVNSGRITDAVTPFIEDGKDVLFITCSAGISGTYNQAVEAAKAVNDKYGETRMLVCDGANASLGEGLLAVQAAKLRDAGEDMTSVKENFDEARWKMNSIFTVNDLKYLRRGGRISATLAVAGTILNIKPILIADANGKIVQHASVRGRKKAIASIADEFAAKAENAAEQTVAIAHCNCPDDAEKLAEAVRERGAKDIVIQMYDICSGTHLGPGGLALFFMGKDRRDAVKESKGGVLGAIKKKLQQQ